MYGRPSNYECMEGHQILKYIKLILIIINLHTSILAESCYIIAQTFVLPYCSTIVWYSFEEKDQNDLLMLLINLAV